MQSVTFGGAPFSIPVPIGAGVGARIAQETAELKRTVFKGLEEQLWKVKFQAMAHAAVTELIESEEAKKLPGLKTLILNKIVPILPDAVKDSWLQENYPYDYTMIILRNILKPESETTVEEAFNLASEAEVKALMDFFTVTSEGKTPTVAGKTNASRRSNGTRKRNR